MSNRNLPEGWIYTTLEQISEIILGQSPPSSTYNIDGKGLPFYQGKLEFGETYPTPRWDAVVPRLKSIKNEIQGGDYALSENSDLGSNKVYLSRLLRGISLTDILVFPKNDLHSNPFLFYRLLCPDFVNYAATTSVVTICLR